MKLECQLDLKATHSAFQGVFAASVCVMKPDLSIDLVETERHFEAILSVRGISGLLVNGHAGEGPALSRPERKEVIRLSRDIAPSATSIVAGIHAHDGSAAASEAAAAQEAGADAVLVFPPDAWSGKISEDVVMDFHARIVGGCNLPIFLYTAPVTFGRLAYDESLIEKLVRLERVVGIKEGSWEVSRYEANRRLARSVSPLLSVMASGDEHLLASFVLGTEGSMVSIACITPETVVELYEAVRENDLARARKAHEIVYPLAKAIYGVPPFGQATARLKTCLRLLGRITSDATRPPLHTLDAAEAGDLENTLRSVALL